MLRCEGDVPLLAWHNLRIAWLLAPRARFTGSTLSAADVCTFGGSATLDALNVSEGRSTLLGVEVASAPVSRTDDDCVALNSGCQSELPAPVCNVFLTIFILTGGWRVEDSEVRVARELSAAE